MAVLSSSQIFWLSWICESTPVTHSAPPSWTRCEVAMLRNAVQREQCAFTAPAAEPCSFVPYLMYWNPPGPDHCCRCRVRVFASSCIVPARKNA
eukprot:4066148-Pyramimonas_sp.AAC.1